MKRFFAIGCALLAAGLVQADVYSIAKQEARNVANGKTPSGGANPNYQTPPPPAATPTVPSPPNPALQVTLENIAALRTDFENLVNNPTNTVALNHDLAAAAQTIKPSTKAVNKLTQDLAAVVAANKSLKSGYQQLAQYVHALFNSSHLSPAQQDAVCNKVQQLLQNAGAPADDVAKVMDDLKAIAVATR
jgi:hypothetical protein